MHTTEQIHQDLDYVAAMVRRRDTDLGTPSIYLLWAVLVLIGFALPDFAPNAAGPYWFVAGIGGGVLSWWLGVRDDRRHGVNDRELGKRYGLHWGIGGLAYFLTALPMFVHGPSDSAAAGFLLTTGIIYSLAGVHLVRALLWSGLLAFAGYAALITLSLPYVWTISGVLIATGLATSGIVAARARAVGATQ